MIHITVIAYIVYLTICLALTVWVAHVLFKNAYAFFDEIFKEKPEFSESMNHLLKVGFYLINFGLILFLLDSGHYPANVKELVEILSLKVGKIVILLGAMHFMNVYLLFRLRRIHLDSEELMMDIKNSPMG